MFQASRGEMRGSLPQDRLSGLLDFWPTDNTFSKREMASFALLIPEMEDTRGRLHSEIAPTPWLTKLTHQPRSIDVKTKPAGTTRPLNL